MMRNDWVQAAVCNNVGHQRRNNEDNFCLNGKYMPLQAMDMGGTFVCEAGGLQVYAVCDGMGGGDKGEEASFTVAEALAEAARQDRLHSIRQLNALMQRTSDAIYRKHDTLSGSTVALLILAEGRAIVMNVGDSRVYRLRSGKLEQVSCDHVGYQAHSITQYLGMPDDESLTPSYHIDDMRQWTSGGDEDAAVFLLCSDGLTDMVADEDICAVLTAEKRPRFAAEKLVDMALRHGGRDNVTAMVVRVPERAAREDSGLSADRWMTALQILCGAGAAYTLMELILRIAAH